MAINKEINKNLSITVPKEVWQKLEIEAKKNFRSVSKQGFLYLMKGLQLSEEKRDD